MRLSGDRPSPVTVTTIPSVTMTKFLQNLLAFSHQGGCNKFKDDDDHNNNNCNENELEGNTIYDEGIGSFRSEACLK
jgi:hypothetical protein